MWQAYIDESASARAHVRTHTGELVPRAWCGNWFVACINHALSCLTTLFLCCAVFFLPLPTDMTPPQSPFHADKPMQLPQCPPMMLPIIGNPEVVATVTVSIPQGVLKPTKKTSKRKVRGLT